MIVVKMINFDGVYPIWSESVWYVARRVTCYMLSAL